MKIGYSVEGSTDRAVLEGLHRRWCPQAELIPGPFRGTTGQSARREIPNTCLQFQAQGVDMAVFLRDANNEDWRDVRKADSERCRLEHRHLAVFGVADRNVECWLCADADWIAARIGVAPGAFRVKDPKTAFEKALGTTRTDKKEAEITALVENAPLRAWLGNKSFEAFYEDLSQAAKSLSCTLENLRVSPVRGD